jgi:hypothetical protein
MITGLQVVPLLLLLNLLMRYSCDVDEILRVILPEELREGSPSGFAATGHVGR